MIKVVNTVSIYEVNGTEHRGLDAPTLTVSSHWNNDRSVVLELDGKKITVAASDLHAAITNACNTKRFL
jgi:hypothetical protein